MSTVCDYLPTRDVTPKSGQLCVQPRAQVWGQTCDVSPMSPMRPERVSRVPSIRAAYPVIRSNAFRSSLSSPRGSMSFLSASVKHAHFSRQRSRLYIPNAADAAPAGAPPVGGLSVEATPGFRLLASRQRPSVP